MFGYRHLSWSFSITYRFLADIFFKNQSAAIYDYREDSMAYIFVTYRLKINFRITTWLYL